MNAPPDPVHPLRRALGWSMVLVFSLIAPRHSIGAARSADSAAAPPADSGAAAPHPRALPSGLELLHLVPAGQPPLDVLDFDNLDQLKDEFNAASDRVRVVLMLSPT